MSLSVPAIWLFATGLAVAAPAAADPGPDPVVPMVEGVIVKTRRPEAFDATLFASSGVVSGEALTLRPLLRTGEVLETTPGMIVTAHTSGGKANQYVLRGFNLDHGTDFAAAVDGVPVNFGSHAHGQGYMDLNWLIPELVAEVAYRKGPYYADAGDISAAGSASVSYVTRAAQLFIRLEAGSDAYLRALAAGSTRLGPGDLLLAGGWTRYDGPSATPGNYRRPNALLKYTLGDDRSGGGISLQTYQARWAASDQIPAAAIPTLTGGRYGSLDPTGTGQTYRQSAAFDWRWSDGGRTTDVQLFAISYGLDLYSNFSGYID